MEHRHNKRYPLVLNAKIKTFDDQMSQFTTCDISIGGMGLTCQDPQLQLHQIVEICLSVKDHLTRQYLLKGMVVHILDNRIGVMFMRSYAAEVYHLLLTAGRNDNRHQPGITKQTALSSTKKSIGSGG